MHSSKKKLAIGGVLSALAAILFIWLIISPISDIQAYEDILSFILLYKYVALFAVVFAGSFGVPTMTVTATLAAAAYASEGYMDWPWVFVAAFSGSFCGDLFLYWLARIFEERTINSVFFRRFFTAERRAVISAHFNKHPALTIIGSKFTNITTIIVNILSGFVKFSFTRFVFLNFIGEFIVTALFVFLGFTFGGSLIYIYGLLEKAGVLFLLILVLALYKPIRKLLKI